MPRLEHAARRDERSYAEPEEARPSKAEDVEVRIRVKANTADAAVALSDADRALNRGKKVRVESGPYRSIELQRQEATLRQKLEESAARVKSLMRDPISRIVLAGALAMSGLAGAVAVKHAERPAPAATSTEQPPEIMRRTLELGRQARSQENAFEMAGGVASMAEEDGLLKEYAGREPHEFDEALERFPAMAEIYRYLGREMGDRVKTRTLELLYENLLSQPQPDVDLAVRQAVLTRHSPVEFARQIGNVELMTRLIREAIDDPYPLSPERSAFAVLDDAGYENAATIIPRLDRRHREILLQGLRSQLPEQQGQLSEENRRQADGMEEEEELEQNRERLRLRVLGMQNAIRILEAIGS